MKKSIYILTSLFLVIFTNPIFAQLADPGETDPGEPTAAPIDDYVLFLALIGLLYVFLRIRTFAKQGNAESK